jgi:hypothetical protein
MRPGFLMFVLLCAILAGCQPGKLATTTTPTTPVIHQHKWGDYVIEYDDMPGTDYSFQANFEDDGNGSQAEAVNLMIDGKSPQLRFRSGTVGLNGVEYGTVLKR